MPFRPLRVETLDRSAAKVCRAADSNFEADSRLYCFATVTEGPMDPFVVWVRRQGWTKHGICEGGGRHVLKSPDKGEPARRSKSVTWLSTSGSLLLRSGLNSNALFVKHRLSCRVHVRRDGKPRFKGQSEIPNPLPLAAASAEQHTSWRFDRRRCSCHFG